MNVQVLIDSIVRQTTVLIAQLATSAGARAPLAHVANQVFLELVGELKTYQGQSLWESVLEYVQGKGTVQRAEVLRRFHYDDEASVRGVLEDLVNSGMLFRAGRNQATTYRAANLDDLAQSQKEEETQEGLANLVWVAVHRHGPATAVELARSLSMGPEELSTALSWVEAGRVQALPGDVPRYRSQSCVIPVGAPVGWEAAVYDHFQALVTALAGHAAVRIAEPCRSRCTRCTGTARPRIPHPNGRSPATCSSARTARRSARCIRRTRCFRLAAAEPVTRPEDSLGARGGGPACTGPEESPRIQRRTRQRPRPGSSRDAPERDTSLRRAAPEHPCADGCAVPRGTSRSLK